MHTKVNLQRKGMNLNDSFIAKTKKSANHLQPLQPCVKLGGGWHGHKETTTALELNLAIPQALECG